LSPEEWISAQKAVASEVSDDLDEGWVDEAAFVAADANGDGALDMEEFLEASCAMFEGVKKRADSILQTLLRVEKVLNQQRMAGRKETSPCTVYVQSSEKPEFQPPSMSWQDEPTEEDGSKNANAWVPAGEVALPLNLQTAEDVAALLRLFLKMPSEMWISVFYLGPAKDGKGPRPVTLLRGDQPGQGNTAAMLQYLSKPSAELKLFVKNTRKRPTKLIRQPRAFLEERDSLFAARVGGAWGLDWETQLVGDGESLPPRPMMMQQGETLIIEVPQTDENGEYRYVANAFMSTTEVLSRPVNEIIEVKAKKTKKKGKSGPEPDPLLQLTFVALKEGKCVLFVDVSWEDQEEKLCAQHSLTAPVAENTIARIGPIEVEVQKATGKLDKGAMQWWNGEKWSNKKGPAKKKKKGKK